MGALEETLVVMRQARESSDAAIVAYSGGKDSVVTMELAARTFSRVEAFFMYTVPDLQCVQAAFDYSRERWGIVPHQFPHPMTYDALRRGVYSRPTFRLDALRDYKLHDVYQAARSKLGIQTILDGQKRGDSLLRRRLLSKEGAQGHDDLWHPIADWTNQDVWAYIKRHELKAPLSLHLGGTSSGIDLTEDSLLWLHDNWTEDWQKLLSIFPFAEAVVWRQKFYGTRKERQAAKRAALAREQAAAS